MTCGATVWPFSPTKAPGWRPGVRGQANRTAGYPLPFCQKAKRAKKTLICYGDRPCEPAPMSTLRAKQCVSRDRGAGMISKNPALPAREPDGANHPHLSSNLVAAQTECPQTCLTAPCASHGSLALDSPIQKRARLQWFVEPSYPGITTDNDGSDVPLTVIPAAVS